MDDVELCIFADMVNAEVTKEMMQLQAQLSNAIQNQMSMLSQTQLALEQAKRGAAVSTAAAAAAMGVGGSSNLGGFSQQRANVTQGSVLLCCSCISCLK